MELTREEAIRNYREHWASNAITGVDEDHKDDYLKRHKFPKIKNNCFLCEFVQDTVNSTCLKKCPIEWPATSGRGAQPCMRSYYGDWNDATTPDERKRLAAIIRDLPEKKIEEPKPEPKFKKGDKVVPVSKTAGASWGFVFNDSSDLHNNFFKEHGFLVVSSIRDMENKINCGADGVNGYWFRESDLRPYVEPKAEKQPEGFQMGDRVKCKTNGQIGTIKGILDPEHPCIGVEFDEPFIKGHDFNSHLPKGKDGYCYFFTDFQIELLPSINLCPEPKTLTESKKFTFKGNKTVCTIEIDGMKFKGVAKCDPNDEWDEEIGRQYAELRANRKMLDAVEKELRRG